MAQRLDTTVLPPPLTGDGNLAALLTWAATRWPHRCALVHEGVELSYADLERRSQLGAGYLAEIGIERGDRVGLQVPNSPAFVALYFGILRLGAIVVPQNPLATPAETDQNLEDAGAEIVLFRAAPGTPIDGSSGRVRRVRIEDENAAGLLDGSDPRPDVDPVAPQDTAVILYTSGTTGRPEGAELTHANLGPVYGLAGQVGAGASEVLRALAGLMPQARGQSVIFATSDLEELLELAMTVITMRAGRVVGVYPDGVSRQVMLSDLTHYQRWASGSSRRSRSRSWSARSSPPRRAC